MNERRLALWLLALLTVVWGLNWPIMKVGIEGVEPWTFRAFTTMFGGSAMLAAASIGGHRIRVPWDQFRLICLIGPVSIGGWMVFSALGLEHMASGRAAIAAYTMPLWAVIFARILLGEAITWRRALGLAIGLAGMVILIGADLPAIGESPLGIIYMLCGALTWGAGTVLFKRAPWRIPVAVIIGWQLLVIGVPITAIAFLTETPRLDYATSSWFAIFYQIFISALIGNYAWAKIVTLLPAGVAAISSLAIPVLGVLSGAMLLGEPVTWRELVALACVVAALAVVLVRSGSPHRDARET
jgi:drug/metabolite transporter (DMT)-like permease